MDITTYKQDKDIDIDKYIDINIMYKYIIFFGVMFRNIIREANGDLGVSKRTKLVGVSLRRLDLALKGQFDTLGDTLELSALEAYVRTFT